jgi:hypothetical protein
VCTSQKSLDIHKREKHGMLKEWSMPQQHQQQLQQHQESILQSSISTEKFLGQIFILKFWTKFHPETAYLIVVGI